MSYCVHRRHLNALARVSVCELECDAIAADILNKAMILSSSDLEQTFSDNPGLNALWMDEVERRRELGSQNSYPELSVPLIEGQHFPTGVVILIMDLLNVVMLPSLCSITIYLLKA